MVNLDTTGHVQLYLFYSLASKSVAVPLVVPGIGKGVGAHYIAIGVHHYFWN